jgi:hypothetical protein
VLIRRILESFHTVPPGCRVRVILGWGQCENRETRHALYVDDGRISSCKVQGGQVGQHLQGDHEWVPDGAFGVHAVNVGFHKRTDAEFLAPVLLELFEERGDVGCRIVLCTVLGTCRS